jgi:hypothetical protein
LLLAALGVAACVDLGVNDRVVTLWETQLTPDVTYPGVSGQAAAVSDVGGTAVGIGMEGATPGAQHAWGVALGSCATPAQQFGPDSDYPVLAVSDSGTASVETRLGARLAGGNAYHVAVRLSASDTARVACGDLVER